MSKQAPKQRKSKTARLYMTAGRKQWHHDPLPSGWNEIGWERFNYIECAVFEKTATRFTLADKELIEAYGEPDDDFIMPSDTPPLPDHFPETLPSHEGLGGPEVPLSPNLGTPETPSFEEVVETATEGVYRWTVDVINGAYETAGIAPILGTGSALPRQPKLSSPLTPQL